MQSVSQERGNHYKQFLKRAIRVKKFLGGKHFKTYQRSRFNETY